MGEVIDILEAYPGSAFSFMLFSISTVHLLELLPFSRKRSSCHGCRAFWASGQFTLNMRTYALLENMLIESRT